MADVANYGTVQHSTRTLTIGAKSYVCNSFSPSMPTKEINRLGADAVPTGFALVADFVKGTANLQMTSDGTLPAVGATFTTGAAPVGTWVISSVALSESIAAEKTININFNLTTFVL